jgi:hypothetical protein
MRKTSEYHLLEIEINTHGGLKYFQSHKILDGTLVKDSRKGAILNNQLLFIGGDGTDT